MLAHAKDSEPVFSSAAIAQLKETLGYYGRTGSEDRREELRAALEVLCREAHAKGLGPEKMLVAVKATWFDLPGIAKLDPLLSAEVFGRVLGFCLKAYYGADSVPKRSPPRL
jgi:hypothetical protein